MKVGPQGQEEEEEEEVEKRRNRRRRSIRNKTAEGIVWVGLHQTTRQDNHHWIFCFSCASLPGHRQSAARCCGYVNQSVKKYLYGRKSKIRV